MSSEIDVIKIQAIEKRVFQNLQGVLDQMKTMEKKMQVVTEENNVLKGQVIQQKIDIDELRRQLALLQQQFYAKGTTSYGDNGGLADKGGDSVPK